ncbi:MAG: M15 family metallopeptidase [Acidobacteriota bacterium]
MASRSEIDLTIKAREAWVSSAVEFREKYPNSPQPFLSCTYRSPEEQNALYAQGRTKPGKVVTNAKAGQSNHTKYPSPAFDIAFKDGAGRVHWTVDLFKLFSVIAKRNGLSWGGDWKSFKDYPHFESV